METLFGMLDLGWAFAQLTEGSPLPFLLWTAFSFALGFAAGRAWGTHVEVRGIARELGRYEGFERVNTVGRLIEKADALWHELAAANARVSELEARPTRDELASLRAENEELRARLGAAYASAGISRDELDDRIGRYLEGHMATEGDIDAMFAPQCRDADGHLTVSEAGMRLIEPKMASAALELLRGGEVHDGTELGRAAGRSVDRRDWLFQPEFLMSGGSPVRDRPLGTYRLHPAWAAYLRDPGRQEALRRIAGGA